MTIRHLAYRIGHSFKGSIAGLASMMGKGEQVLSNKLNPNSESHHLNIQEFEMMVDFTAENLMVAEYFAAKANAVVVKLPDAPNGDMALLDAFMKITTELGDASTKFQKAYADGDISNFESDLIAKEIDDVVSALVEFKACVKRIVR